MEIFLEIQQIELIPLARKNLVYWIEWQMQSSE
jgi:hypothetical protein